MFHATKSALLGVAACLALSGGMVVAQSTDKASANTGVSARQKAMRDCHAQITAAGNDKSRPAQRRALMGACLKAKNEAAMAQANLQFGDGAPRE